MTEPMSAERLAEIRADYEDGASDTLECMIELMTMGNDRWLNNPTSRKRWFASIERYQADHVALLAEVERLEQELAFTKQLLAQGDAAAHTVLAKLGWATRLLGGLRTEWAFQYTVYGVTETSLPCGTREDAEREAGRHHRGAPIVSRLVQDWQPDQYETDIEEGPDPKAGDHGTCSPCGQPIVYIDSPHGGWWAHEVHPADGHDAAIGGPA